MENNLFELTREDMKKKINIIVGNEKIRKQLKEIIKNIFEDRNNQNIIEFLNLNGNILLHGKPGTGKTSMCYECMLSKEKANYYHLNISTLISEKLGKTPKMIDEFFKKVQKKTEDYQVFLLVEEIEAFLPDRNNSKELEDMKRALTIFMHYLDKSIKNLVVICTTNFKNKLDEAIIRRFSFQYEINNNEKNAFIKFLTYEKNPFRDSFKDEKENEKIAELLIKNRNTFSDVKHFMRELYISGKEVNSENFLREIEEDNNE